MADLWDDDESEEIDLESMPTGPAKPAPATRRTKKKGQREMPQQNDGWESDENEPEEWDADESDSEPMPTGPAKPAPQPAQEPTTPQVDEWEEDHSDEEKTQTTRKQNSTNKTKIRKQKLKELEKTKLAKKKKEEDSDDDSCFDTTDEEDENEGTGFEDRHAADNEILFGTAEEQRIKKPKKKQKVVVQKATIRDIYPISKGERRFQNQDLKKMAKGVCDYILDLSTEAEDQNGKTVHPRLKTFQVKDFLCTIMNRLSRPLDIQELSAVRTQAEAEISQLRARMRKESQLKKQGKQGRKHRRRVVHVEEEVTNYIEGEYNDHEFDDLFG